MKRILLLALLLPLLAQAATDADLVGKQVGSIATDATATPQTGRWYVVTNEKSPLYYLEAGTSSLSVTAPSGATADCAARLFKIVSEANGAFRLVSGDGQQLTLTQTQGAWSNQASASWTTGEGTPIVYTEGHLLRTTTTLATKKENLTTYGFLDRSNQTLSATSAQAGTEVSPFYFREVTLVTPVVHHTVSFAFTYTEDDTPKTLSTSYTVERGDAFPVASLDDAFRQASLQDGHDVRGRYEIDTPDPAFATHPALVQSDLTYTSMLRERSVTIDQDLTYKDITLFEGDYVVLADYLLLATPNAQITYAVTQGGDKVRLTDGGIRLQALQAGTATLTATAAAFGNYNLTTAQIHVTVTGLTDKQKAFLTVYDQLDDYRTKIGDRLGQYSYADGNKTYFDKLYAYVDQRAHIRAYDEDDLPTQELQTFLTRLEANLSLNLPHDEGHLLTIDDDPQLYYYRGSQLITYPRASPPRTPSRPRTRSSATASTPRTDKAPTVSTTRTPSPSASPHTGRPPSTPPCPSSYPPR